VLQLSALGYLLAPVFAYDSWWLVLLFAAAAVAVASAEAVSHPPAFYRVRQYWHTTRREISESMSSEPVWHPPASYRVRQLACIMHKCNHRRK
jgi:hypothetical protein